MLLYYAYSQRKKTAGWDVFQDPPPPEEDDTINPQWIDVSLKITKVIVYIITASVVLSSSIIAKGTCKLLHLTCSPKVKIDYSIS